tara:strand:- start:63490 stop:63813 length:324 start_codon:yes stop_codon:yes gene_type:complete
MQNIKLTTADRKALAICGHRLPICDLGKDRYRSRISDLTRTHPQYVAMTQDGRRWELTDLGRAMMGRAGKGSTWVKWAADAGREQDMIDALNSGGTEAGHVLLREMR